MTQLRSHGPGRGVSRRAGWRVPAACRLALIVWILAPTTAPAQQSSSPSAGVIVGPTPTSPKTRPPGVGPGCMILFKSPSWPGVDPGRPCAARCTCTGTTAAVDPDDLASACNRSFGPQGGYDLMYRGTDDNEIPPTNAPSMPHCRCEVFSGPQDPDYRQWPFYFPNGHPACGGVVGEPHLSTFDDLRYDLMAAGEFVVARSLDDELEVQMRLEPFDRRIDIVSIATAVAARVGDARITIQPGAEMPLRIDGATVELPDRNEIRIPSARAVILRNGRTYSVVWPDDTNLHVEVGLNNVDFFVLPSQSRDGRLVGVLGNADGDDSNDFRTRDGRQLAAPPEFEALYADFAESWRVRPGESLFDYEPGESTDTFTLRDMPREKVTIDDQDLGARTRAEQRCRDAGVFEAVAMEQCVFDVGFTGEDAFILSALAIQRPPDFLRPASTHTVATPQAGAGQTGAIAVTVDAPSEGIAAHDIEIGVQGHEGDAWFGFLPAGGDATGARADPYSWTSLTGDEETVSLAVPILPGDYELLYRRPGDQTVLLRRPFRVRAPQLTIEAASSAALGDSLAVRLTGDVGARMTVTIVPAGSPDAELRPPFLYTDQGTEARLVLRNLPEEAGRYEIRVKSDWGGVIYARRELTIR
jgi:hypothetical protein